MSSKDNPVFVQQGGELTQDKHMIALQVGNVGLISKWRSREKPKWWPRTTCRLGEKVRAGESGDRPRALALQPLGRRSRVRRPNIDTIAIRVSAAHVC